MVYAVGNNLFAATFDLNKLEAGNPVPIVEGVFRLASAGFPLYSVSDTGTLVYVPQTVGAAALAQSDLVWVDRNGREVPLGAPPNNYGAPRISPDGTRVALSITSGQSIVSGRSDIWTWDLARKALTRLTFEGTANLVPVWSPDANGLPFIQLAIQAEMLKRSGGKLRTALKRTSLLVLNRQKQQKDFLPHGRVMVIPWP
jgi:Tol biopolymer transport system component